MKRIIGYITVAATICAIAVSCSGINKIIKSGDPEFAYRQAVELYDAGKWSKASTLFEACAHIYVGTPREDSLSFYNARCKFKDKDWDSASMLLDEFRRKFGRSPFIEEAEGMYAHCFFRMAPGPKRDQAPHDAGHSGHIGVHVALSRLGADTPVQGDARHTLGALAGEELHECLYIL